MWVCLVGEKHPTFSRREPEGGYGARVEKPPHSCARLSVRDPWQFEYRQWPRWRNVPFYPMAETSPNAGSGHVTIFHQVYTEVDMAAVAEQIWCEQRETAATGAVNAVGSSSGLLRALPFRPGPGKVAEEVNHCC